MFHKLWETLKKMYRKLGKNAGNRGHNIIFFPPIILICCAKKSTKIQLGENI